MNALSNFPSKKVEQPDRQFSDHERKKLLSMDDMLMPRLVQSGKSLSFSFARKKKSTDVGILKSMETFLKCMKRLRAKTHIKCLCVFTPLSTIQWAVCGLIII